MTKKSDKPSGGKVPKPDPDLVIKASSREIDLGKDNTFGNVGGNIVIGNINGTIVFMGDNSNVSINFEGAAKQRLAELVTQLTKELEPFSSSINEVEAISVLLEELINEIGKKRHNHLLLTIRVDNIRRVASDFASVAPSVLDIALQITTLALRETGQGDGDTHERDG